MLLMDCFINSGVISSEFPTAFYQLSSTAVFTVLITADRVNWICNQRVGSLKGILASPSQIQKFGRKNCAMARLRLFSAAQYALLHIWFSDNGWRA